MSVPEARKLGRGTLISTDRRSCPNTRFDAMQPFPILEDRVGVWTDIESDDVGVRFRLRANHWRLNLFCVLAIGGFVAWFTVAAIRAGAWQGFAAAGIVWLFALPLIVGDLRGILRARRAIVFEVLDGDSLPDADRRKGKRIPAGEITGLEIRLNENRASDDMELAQLFVQHAGEWNLVHQEPTGARMARLVEAAERLAERWRTRLVDRTAEEAERNEPCTK